MTKASENSASQIDNVLSYEIIDHIADGEAEIGYMKMKLPLLDQRDMVFLNADIDLENHGRLWVRESTEHAKYQSQSNIIRMKCYGATHIKKFGNDLIITKYSHFDIGGQFPNIILTKLMGMNQESQIENMYNSLLEGSSSMN